MSLLTEEQIEEIFKFFDADEHEFINFYEEIRRWNEKQTGIQVKPNWDLAPKEATAADIKLVWRGIENSWMFEAVFASIPRPTTPHPHAEIIAKYAEVAARRCDPWVEFEWFDRINDMWAVCECCMEFNISRSYRHIGDKP